jgi:ribosomal protein S12 methylthiotransferase accessory factor
MKCGTSSRCFQEVPTRRGSTLEDDVAWEIERLRAVGVRQIAVVDLTKPEFGIPVVRVVIPGLEGVDHSSNYCPGVRARARQRLSS